MSASTLRSPRGPRFHTITSLDLDRLTAHAAELAPPADGGRAEARSERIAHGFVAARESLAGQRRTPRPETVDLLRRMAPEGRWSGEAEIAGPLAEVERGVGREVGR